MEDVVNPEEFERAIAGFGEFPDKSVLGIPSPNTEEAHAVHKTFFYQVAHGGGMAHAERFLSDSPDFNDMLIDMIDLYANNPDYNVKSLGRGVLIALESLGHLETFRQQNGSAETE